MLLVEGQGQSDFLVRVHVLLEDVFGEELPVAEVAHEVDLFRLDRLGLFQSGAEVQVLEVIVLVGVARDKGLSPLVQLMLASEGGGFGRGGRVVGR